MNPNNLEHKNTESSFKEKYKSFADQEGYLDLSQLRQEFGGRQIKNIASLLDGEGGLSPEYNLGEGLDFKGDSGNYSSMKINVDSIDEFIQRVNNHYK